MELKAMGMGLKEIQLMFELKKAFGCGDKQLIAEVVLHLTDHLAALRQAEELLHRRRLNLENELKQVEQLLAPAPLSPTTGMASDA
jgi:hypothetical protein